MSRRGPAPPCSTLTALLGRAPAPLGGPLPKMLVADDVGDCVEVPGAEQLPARALAARLRELGEVGLLAVRSIGATLRRALRDHPPGLLVWAGADTPESRAQLSELAEELDCATLGPAASLFVTDRPAGEVILACAATRAELSGLRRALASGEEAAPTISLCPGPHWLVDWLSAPEGRDVRAVGYLPRSSLHVGWARWIRDDPDAARHVLVPLGLPRAPVDLPRASELETAVAGHALERRYGPIYPAPRVLELIRRGLPGEAAAHHDDDALELWQQARRALPLSGGALGMERPLPGMDLRAPTATFLAQRVLLRARRGDELVASLEDGALDLPPLEDELVQRAMQVLSASGETLSEHESKVVLRGFGIEITRQAVASSASGAAQYADRIGYPVVVKVVSPDLRRKQDAGAVQLDLPNAAAVRRAHAQVLRAVEEQAPTARVDGVVVAEMIGPGTEVHCGAVRLRDGSVALHGRVVDVPGPTEPLLALAPLAPGEALRFAHAVLAQVPVPALRRASDPDVRVLARVFLLLQRLCDHTEERLLSIELGPLRLLEPGADERDCVTLDATIIQRAHLEGL